MDPVQRLRVVTALTSAVALNVARTIADSADAGVNSLVVTQVGLIIGGLVVSLLLAAGLIAITRPDDPLPHPDREPFLAALRRTR